MPFLRSLLAFTALALLAGCQTTSIQSAWFDSSYRGGPFRKIVVIASDGTTADSRVFEDIMVQSLQAAGVAAIPGYTTVPPDARRAEGAVRRRGRRDRRRRRDPRAPDPRRHQDAGARR